MLFNNWENRIKYFIQLAEENYDWIVTYPKHFKAMVKEWGITQKDFFIILEYLAGWPGYIFVDEPNSPSNNQFLFNLYLYSGNGRVKICGGSVFKDHFDYTVQGLRDCICEVLYQTFRFPKEIALDASQHTKFSLYLWQKLSGGGDSDFILPT